MNESQQSDLKAMCSVVLKPARTVEHRRNESRGSRSLIPLPSREQALATDARISQHAIDSNAALGSHDANIACASLFRSRCFLFPTVTVVACGKTIVFESLLLLGPNRIFRDQKRFKEPRNCTEKLEHLQDAVEKVLEDPKSHDICGKLVECKRCVPGAV